MFDEIPISTIKLPEGRFQTFHDISLSEECNARPKILIFSLFHNVTQYWYFSCMYADLGRTSVISNHARFVM